ncbi:MAG: hypothetical protein M3131_00010 [Actinomycetota bacterium]|nr:hypothetical protein [Actinomycetota bacterium]
MVAVVFLAVIVLCVAVVAADGRGGARTKASRGLAVGALVAALLAAVPVFVLAWDDSGLGFAFAVSGLPVALTAGGAVAACRKATPGVVGWLCALLLLAYVVVFALGAGLFLAPAGLLLLASMLLR